jgi:hypothetical protein
LTRGEGRGKILSRSSLGVRRIVDKNMPLRLPCTTLPQQTKHDRRRSRGPLQLALPLLFGGAKQTKRGRRRPRPGPAPAVGWQQQLLPSSSSGGGTGARAHPHVRGMAAATAQLLPRTPGDVQGRLRRWRGSRRRIRYSGASKGRERGGGAHQAEEGGDGEKRADGREARAGI